MEHLKSFGPMDLVYVEFLCIHNDSSGVAKIFILTDRYTHFAQTYSTKDQKSVTVAKALYGEYFCALWFVKSNSI